MYICAQRVQDPDGSRPIVGQCYLHPSSAHPERLNDVRWVAQQEPGVFVGAMTDRRGAGRRVLSFLDLTGPDRLSRAEILDALGAYRAALDAGLRGPYRSELAGAELYVDATIPFETRIDEFDALAAVLSELIDFAVGASAPRRGLTIRAAREGDRAVLRWDDASRERIAREKPEWLAPTFSIDDATQREFEERWGSIYPVAFDALFPLDRDHLVALRGAAVLDASTGKTLWVTEEE